MDITVRKNLHSAVIHEIKHRTFYRHVTTSVELTEFSVHGHQFHLLQFLVSYLVGKNAPFVGLTNQTEAVQILAFLATHERVQAELVLKTGTNFGMMATSSP